MQKSVSIIGMGQVGQALASYFLSKQYTVYGWNRHCFGNKRTSLENNSFLYNGQDVGRIVLYNQDLSKIDIRSEVIIVATLANGHDEIIKAFQDRVVGKKIIIIPGCFGSYYVFNCLKGNDIYEINPSPFSARVSGTVGNFDFFSEKKKYYIGTNDDTDQIIPLFPKGVTVSPIESSLLNIEMILHPIIALCTENNDYYFYREGINEKSLDLIEGVDEERLALARCLGIKIDSIANTLKKEYQALNTGVYPRGIEHIFTKTIPFINSGIVYNDCDYSRYISEEIPYRLVPFYYLGKRCGLGMCTTQAVIDLACERENINYYKEGRRLPILDI